jgi:hypothetical protein
MNNDMKWDVFEYLKDNLEVRLKHTSYYQPDSTTYWTELWLKSPDDEEVKISESESFNVSGYTI